MVAQAGNENVVGQWSAPMAWPINAIHAVLTPDGKVLSYGTDPAGAQGAQLYYDVWNPASNAHSLLQHSTRTDIFCSAQSVLPESGQVLIVGGDTRGVHARPGQLGRARRQPVRSLRADDDRRAADGPMRAGTARRCLWRMAACW